MAKKGNRITIDMESSVSGFRYQTEKNKRNNTSRIELKKYDPVVRKHVMFKEAK